MSKKQKIGKKIMKDIIKNLDDNRILHIIPTEFKEIDDLF